MSSSWVLPSVTWWLGEQLSTLLLREGGLTAAPGDDGSYPERNDPPLPVTVDFESRAGGFPAFSSSSHGASYHPPPKGIKFPSIEIALLALALLQFLVQFINNLQQLIQTLTTNAGRRRRRSVGWLNPLSPVTAYFDAMAEILPVHRHGGNLTADSINASFKDLLGTLDSSPWTLDSAW